MMRRIIIIGGSFGGMSCAMHIMRTNEMNVQIHLVEPANYLEYNPSNLRSIVDPHSHADVMVTADHLVVNQTTDPIRFMRYQTSVVSIGDADVTLRNGAVLPYDYLVIAIGSGYANSLKPDHAFTITDRQAQIVAKHRELESAEFVTIVGAGLVGVELAAEVAVRYGVNKQCRLITRNDIILPMLPKCAQQYARKFMNNHDVKIEDGQGKHVQHFVSCAQNNEIVFDCTGILPVRFPLFTTNSGSVDLNVEGRTGFMKVNHYLQLLPRVFCVGDCANDPYGSTKLAYTAELQGEITAHNIIKLIRNGTHAELSAFPQSLSKVLPPPSVICCSLGPDDGVLCFNDISVTGTLAAWMKWLIERSKVGQYRGEFMSRCLWKIGEPATFFMNIMYQSVAYCLERATGWMRTSPLLPAMQQQ